MTSQRVSLLTSLLSLMLVASVCAAEIASRYEETIEEKGLKITYELEPVRLDEKSDKPLTESEFADIRFTITDATTGAPVSPLEPAVWIDPINKGGEIPECKERLKRYTQGTLNFQAAVDLNKFFILVMNKDQTISVIDPILGINGYSQLYAMIRLESSGEDWVLSSDQQTLYVTMPRSAKVAVVDLESFEMTGSIDIGARPMRIVAQPDQRYLWVGMDNLRSEKGGVAVIDPLTKQVVSRIDTGTGHHEIVFSDNSLTAFVSNTLDGTVTAVDTQSLKILKQFKVGKNPAALAYSPLGQTVYAGSESSGQIKVIDVESLTIKKTLTTDPGLIRIDMTPDGRWAFAVNGKADRVDILDGAQHALMYRLDVPGKPYQVAFSDTYAYFRTLDSADVNLLRLAELGNERLSPLQSIVMGSSPPGGEARVALAETISATGEWGTVVISNPVDKMIYYYMEGMVAPMGTFTTYGRTPMGVTVIDRSLKEVERGVYQARIRIPTHGEHSVAFLVDTPWIDNCFSFTAAVDPELEKEREAPKPEIVYLSSQSEVEPGQPFELRFNLKRGQASDKDAPLPEVVVMATRPPGNWQIRQVVKPGDDGAYRVQLVPEKPGIYLINFAVPGLQLDFTELPYKVLKVRTPSQNKKEVANAS